MHLYLISDDVIAAHHEGRFGMRNAELLEQRLSPLPVPTNRKYTGSEKMLQALIKTIKVSFFSAWESHLSRCFCLFAPKF